MAVAQQHPCCYMAVLTTSNRALLCQGPRVKHKHDKESMLVEVDRAILCFVGACYGQWKEGGGRLGVCTREDEVLCAL